MPVTIHKFPDEEEAYDASQCWDEIHDGDILIAANVVGVLIKAWPTYIKGPQPKQFHRLAPTETWESFEGGKYFESAKIAMCLDLE